MESDMNKYDLNHVTFDHPRMSREELQRVWWDAWRTYYSTPHLATVVRRALANGIPARNIIVPIIWFWSSIFVCGIHPLEGGFMRCRTRLERRQGLPIERFAAFHFRHGMELLINSLRLIGFVVRITWIGLRSWLSPARRTYSDQSLIPANEGDLDGLELFNVTEAAKTAAALQRHDIARHRRMAG